MNYSSGMTRGPPLRTAERDPSLGPTALVTLLLYPRDEIVRCNNMPSLRRLDDFSTSERQVLQNPSTSRTVEVDWKRSKCTPARHPSLRRSPFLQHPPRVPPFRNQDDGRIDFGRLDTGRSYSSLERFVSCSMCFQINWERHGGIWGICCVRYGIVRSASSRSCRTMDVERECRRMIGAGCMGGIRARNAP